jgi:hypothetical protein
MSGEAVLLRIMVVSNNNMRDPRMLSSRVGPLRRLAFALVRARRYADVAPATPGVNPAPLGFAPVRQTRVTRRMECFSMPNPTRLSFLAAALQLCLAAGVATAAPDARVIVVSSADDAGPGSWRDAVERANADASIGRIQFAGSGWTVALSTTVEFTGPQDLAVDGNRVTLDGSGMTAGPALRVTGGGALRLTALAVRHSPGDGVAVDVPSSAAGTIHVSLHEVQITDNDGHGVVINDQDDPTTTDGMQPNPEGSDASLDVLVVNSDFERNGYSVSDRDGLRVNEGGAGGLSIVVRNTVARDNAADGIEVDERGPGDVTATIVGSIVTGNGSFDPADLDDGVDIDEYDEGDVIAIVAATNASRNFEEGFDFNENNAGDLRVDFQLVSADGNGEEGIDLEEDDDFAGGGDLVVSAAHVGTAGNGVNDDGDAGFKIREKGAGNLRATLEGVKARQNRIGGISLREDADGTLTSSVAGAVASRNAGNGLDFDENGAGNLEATVVVATLLGNAVDLRADEASDGTGSLQVSRVTFTTLGGNVAPSVVP